MRKATAWHQVNKQARGKNSTSTERKILEGTMESRNHKDKIYN